MSITVPWRSTPVTKEEAEDFFMLFLEDDTEDAPWMVMGDLQYWSATGLAHSLRNYVHERQLPWYVASMMPIIFPWRASAVKHQLAPDLFVAFVPERERTSFDVTVEGGFPPFVLEVVSPSSTTRDREEKREAYRLQENVREYFLFNPRLGKPSTLDGFRRAPNGDFVHVRSDRSGRLSSEVLGLRFVVRGNMLRAQTREGELLPTLEEAEAARRQAEEARLQAEAEADRLRQELDRLRRERGLDT